MIPRMTNITGVDKIVAELRTEKTNLTNQLRHVDAALSVLSKLNGGGAAVTPLAQRRPGLSAAARLKISIAQKARWARVKAGKKG